VRHQRIHLKPRGADGSSAANDDASEDGDSCTPTPTSTCPPSENESECGSAVARAKELEEEDVKEEGDGQQEDSGAAVEEGSAKLSDSDPTSEDADIKDKYELSADSAAQQPSSDLTPQATESKTTTSTDSQAAPDSSKDASSSSSPPGGTAAATPAEGIIHGLLEIHTKPPLLPLDSLQSLPPLALGLSSSETMLAGIINSSAPTIFSFTNWGSKSPVQHGHLALSPALLEELGQRLEQSEMQILEFISEENVDHRATERLGRLKELCAFQRKETAAGDEKR